MAFSNVISEMPYVILFTATLQMLQLLSKVPRQSYGCFLPLTDRKFRMAGFLKFRHIWAVKNMKFV